MEYFSCTFLLTDVKYYTCRKNLHGLFIWKRTEYGDLLRHVKPSVGLEFRAQVINLGVILIIAMCPRANSVMNKLLTK